ncbi:hypothetical protein OESDEN_17306 [Oesophagostomum dentatum]|uniref:Uncharacterized protein n=1 Tax=Oesophagostomum dentatum TaxID=61180 RepID=A0A0B1SDJ5_OESDE|nr:hypothetical protein OESDEN_17306 [Oesophagostomum dentatum]
MTPLSSDSLLGIDMSERAFFDRLCHLQKSFSLAGLTVDVHTPLLWLDLVCGQKMVMRISSTLSQFIRM